MEIVALVRDLVVIIVGLIWIVAGALVTAVAWLTWKFMKSMPDRAELVTLPAQELLGQARQAVGTANQSARTAREAIIFVTEKAVMPTIMMASAAAGVRRFFETLLAGSQGRGRSETT